MIDSAFIEFFKNGSVPLEYIDKEKANVPMKAIIFDFLAQEGLNEEQIENIFSDEQKLDRITNLYVKMITEHARAAYILDLGMFSKEGIDYSTDMQKAQARENDYYQEIKNLLEIQRER